MSQALLVNIDLEGWAEILRILDEADLQVSVALWILLDDYNNWRLLLASRKFDNARPLEAHGPANDALRAAGFQIENTPPVLVLTMADLFIRALRRYFGKAKTVEGVRLGGQQIGNPWAEGRRLPNLVTQI